MKFFGIFQDIGTGFDTILDPRWIILETVTGEKTSYYYYIYIYCFFYYADLISTTFLFGYVIGLFD